MEPVGWGHPAAGRWIRDTRGPERALRVSAHAHTGYLVVSTWRDDACVATVRVTAVEAADLMAALAQGLAELVLMPAPTEVLEPVGPVVPPPGPPQLRSV